MEDDAPLTLVNGHSGHEEDMPGQARIYKMTEKEETEHAGHTPEQHQVRVATKVLVFWWRVRGVQVFLG